MSSASGAANLKHERGMHTSSAEKEEEEEVEEHRIPRFKFTLESELGLYCALKKHTIRVGGSGGPPGLFRDRPRRAFDIIPGDVCHVST